MEHIHCWRYLYNLVRLAPWIWSFQPIMFIEHLLCARQCTQSWEKITNKAKRDPILLALIIQHEKHLSVRISQRIARYCRSVF